MAADDGIQPGVTIPRSSFPMGDTAITISEPEMVPMHEIQVIEPRPTVNSITEDNTNRAESAQEIESRRRRRPQRGFQRVSKALPFLLVSLTVYIYYIYTFQVCVQYLIDIKGKLIQGSLYMATFNILIILFLVSYAFSIYSKPGYPSNPPKRNQTISIPPTTTPYQLWIPSNASSNDRIIHDPSPPQNLHQNNPSLASRSRTPSTATGHSSNGQHPSAHLGSIVTSPKYPTSTVAPVNQGMIGYTYSASSEALETRSNHLGISVPGDRRSSHENNGNAIQIHNPSIADGPGGTANGLASLDNQLSTSRSRNTTDESAARLPVATLSICKRDGRSRWCDVCKMVKPDRSHHCSECNRCILRMDHHCPWVNGCIGFGNYKYFYLFILYGSLSALWIVGSMTPILFQIFKDYSNEDCMNEIGCGNNNTAPHNSTSLVNYSSINSTNGAHTQAVNVQWVVITVITCLLALLIVTFTGAHTSYILRNRTTIEALQNVRNTYIRVQYQKISNSADNTHGVGPRTSFHETGVLPSFLTEIEYNVVMVDQGDRLWDRGSWLANWCSVMGPTWWLWFLPYHNAEGDGIHEVYNEKAYNRLVADALAQARMQVVTFGHQQDTNRRAPNNDTVERTEAIKTAPPSPRVGPSVNNNNGSISAISPANIEGNSNAKDKAVADGSQRIKTALIQEAEVPNRQQSPRTRRNTEKSVQTASQSIRFAGPSERQTHVGESPDTTHGESTSDSRSRRTGRQQDPYIGESLESYIVSSSGYSTPRQSSSRHQDSTQNTPKSRSSSNRQRQRTTSGGTSGSYLTDFGMGLGMDGILVNSSTGLKLSSARMKSNHMQGREQLRHQD